MGKYWPWVGAGICALLLIACASTDPYPSLREDRDSINGLIQFDHWVVEALTTQQAQIATLESVVTTLQTPAPTATATVTPTATIPWWWFLPYKQLQESGVR